MSWEAAEQKKEEAAQDENEGYWLSMQVSKSVLIFVLMSILSWGNSNHCHLITR